MEKIGADSEVIFLKNLPQKENFFAQMNVFVQNNISEVRQELISQNFPELYAEDIAIVCLRGTYVFNLLTSEYQSKISLPISLTWSTGMSKGVRAQCIPVFDVNGKISNELKIYELLSLAVSGKKVTLNKIFVEVNLKHVLNEVKYGYLLKTRSLNLYPDNTNLADEFKNEIIDDLRKATELSIVHEIAHVLILNKISKNHKDMIKLLEELSDYKGDGFDNEQEKKILYDDKRLEKKANILVNLFIKKYYSE